MPVDVRGEVRGTGLGQYRICGSTEGRAQRGAPSRIRSLPERRVERQGLDSDI